MNWNEKERTTIIVGLLFSALLLIIYINIIYINWDFATLRTVDGYPIARDYVNYWSASKLALLGKPALVYDINELHGLQLQLIGTQHSHLNGFYYPPVYLLYILPFGFMSYLSSLLIWLGVTLILYLIILSRLSPHSIPLILCLFSPGIYQNFVIGQNGYLCGFLLGGGLLILESAPLIAGCFFGLLCFKPHFIVLVLFALLVGRKWKTIASTLVTSLVLFIISAAIFGLGTWVAYFQVMSIPMKLLEVGQAAWSIMPTFFAAVLSAGFGVKTAYIVQAVVMLGIASGVAWVWSKQVSLAMRGSVLVLGTFLFTPYGFIYDLAILALPLTWLWEEGRVHGRLPGELALLFIGWLMPFIMPLIWSFNFLHGKLQIGPVVLLFLFIFALIKAKIAITRSNLAALAQPATVNNLHTSLSPTPETVPPELP